VSVSSALNAALQLAQKTIIFSALNVCQGSLLAIDSESRSVSELLLVLLNGLRVVRGAGEHHLVGVDVVLHLLQTLALIQMKTGLGIVAEVCDVLGTLDREVASV